MKRFAMVLVMLAGACGGKSALSGNDDRPFAMPATTGLTEQEARAAVMEAGPPGQFKVVGNAECPGVPVGRVCGTEPKAGEKGYKKDEVQILIQSSDAQSGVILDCATFAPGAAEVCAQHKTEVEKYGVPAPK